MSIERPPGLSALFLIVPASMGLTGCPGTLADPGRFEDSGATMDAGCPNVVSTVFTPRCALSGCHTAADRAGQLDLQSPDLYPRLVGVPASGGPGFLIDANGNPNDSVLYLKLTPNPPFGSQMPLVGAKLDPTTLACVASWIKSGSGADGGTKGADATSGQDAASSGHDAAALDAADGGEASVGVDLFIATGYQNRRIVSPDSKTWINDVNDPPSSLDDIGTGLAIGMGMVVVAGHTGIYTSTDAKTWTKLPPPVPQAWPGLGGAAATYGNGTFVIVDSSESWTSTDGVTFAENVPDGSSIGATHWDGLAFGNGHFFAVGDSNGPGDRKVSEDGVNWHDYVQDSTAWSGVAFGAGVFVAVGANGRRAWTPDGVTINDTTDATLGDVNGVAFGDGKFIVAGASGTATSTDGMNWTTSASYPAGAMNFGGGLFLTTTWVSNILTSSDGQTWTTTFSGDSGTPALVRIAWGRIGGS